MSRRLLNTLSTDVRAARMMMVVICVLAAIHCIASDLSPATYVGPNTCVKCHREPSRSTNQPAVDHRRLVEAWRKSAHAATLVDAQTDPERVVAPFTTNSPLQRRQVAYAIGAGRGEQRYCDVSLWMLPHRWDGRGQKWAAELVVDAREQCFGCHVTGYDVATKKWIAPGVTCEACHGPGSRHAEDGSNTRMLNLRSLPLERQAMICGQCHSDGTDTAKVHPFPVGIRPGDDLNEYFAQALQPRPGPKYSELLYSKHSQMNVICTDCHDPHGPVTGTRHQLRKPVNDLCRECHLKESMAKHAPKADPGATCATCHMAGGSHKFGKSAERRF